MSTGIAPEDLATTVRVLNQLHELPDDHPDLQVARGNLANTRYALGDLPGALALDEKAFAVRAH